MNHPSLRKGFTLIEMLITLAILGVVSAIAIPAYNGYIKTAKMSEAHNNLAALRLAEEEYFLDNNEYFDGGNWSTLESDSDNLWTRTKGNKFKIREKLGDDINRINFDKGHLYGRETLFCSKRKSKRRKILYKKKKLKGGNKQIKK